MHETRRIALLKAVETRRDEVATLTRDLVRFPTVNPPGAGYEACARFIGETLEALGFTVEYVRAAGAFADCDQNPRVNVIGRREGRQSGPCVHFNSHFDVVPTGEGWTV
ncbi:MAG: succinyl-diaminopimelate desuccinylase, partial [Pseudomonadota bacterium]